MYTKATYNQSKRILQQTAKALIKKKLVPDYTLAYLTDPGMMHAAIHNYILEPVKEYSCPNCMITVKCPRKWIHLHHQQCVKAHPYYEKQKDPKNLISKINPYYY